LDTTAKAIRHMYRTDLASFVRLAFKLVEPRADFIPHWSIDLVSDALMRCHRGETKRLIINMPPRYLKSFCASVAFPAWSLALRPESKIMCITGNRGLIEDQHQMNLRLMSHPNYRAIFPHIKSLDDRGQTIRLPHGGTRSAHVLAPGSGITGLGADTIIIDDPLPAGYTDDEKRIEQVNRWYDQNVYQRLNDKANGVVIVVMQRLHVGDLTGHLLKQEGWQLLNLPAVAMQDEQYPQLFADRIVRRWGDALNPAIESVKELKDAMWRMGAKTFMAQYQQKPYPPGEGKGLHGVHRWMTPVGPEMPGVGHMNVVFMKRSQEDIIEDELFHAPHCPPSNEPVLRQQTNEEWLTLARKIRRPLTSKSKF